MKKTPLYLLLIALMSVVLVACAAPPAEVEEAVEEAEETVEEAAEAVEAEAEEAVEEAEEMAEEAEEMVEEEMAEEEMTETISVGMVTDVGGIDDRSFNETAWNGLLRAEEELGVEVSFLESQQQTDYATNITQYLDQETDLIVTVGFLLGDDTLTFATENPETAFAIIDFTYEEVPENIRPLLFSVEEPSFMAGYLAAGMTETGTVATYGGLEIPPVTVFMDAYAGGVAYYNEVNATDVEVIGLDLFAGNFESTDDGRRLGEDLISSGADIIFPVAGPVGLGTVAAVQENPGTLMIGVDTDLAVSAPEFSDVVLTSVLKRMDNAVFQTSESVLNGEFAGGENYIGTLENGGVGLAGYGEFEDEVPAELQAEVEEIEAQIIAGELDIASYFPTR